MSIVTVKYNQIDPTAKEDAALTVVDKKTWSDSSLLTVDGVHVENCMTSEHNYSILDGEMDEFPDDPSLYQWGWFSDSQSDDSGMFSTPPVMDISFGNNHTSSGITMYFYPYTDDFARTVNCTWYDGTGTILKTGIYTLTSNVGVISETVAEYRRIVIEFLTTNIRERYIKVFGVDFGITITIEDHEINNPTILEEIDPISDTLSINTFGFLWKTQNPIFSPLIEGVNKAVLMKKQPLYVSSDNENFGTFFLNGWKDIYNDGTTFQFESVDAVGVMDREFLGGMYSNRPLDSLIRELFNICFPTRLITYELDPALQYTYVSGYMPICTCRQALQYLCFSLNIVANSSRNSVVLIYPRPVEQKYTITRDELYKSGGNIDILPYCSGVDVTAFRYAPSKESKEIVNDVFPSGRHFIRYREPMVIISSITGAQPVGGGVNHMLIDVPAEGTVVITGYPYRVNEIVYSAREDIRPGEVENVVLFSKCTMVTTAIAQDLADNLFAYLKQQIRIENEMRLGDRQVGYGSEIETYGRPVVGTIERLNTNIRSGKARVKIVGNVKQVI